MKQTVKVLSGFFLLLSISGCTPKTVYINVPVKCKIPETQEPSIENTSCDTLLCASKVCVKNYNKMKEYAEKLKANSEVCK